MALYDPSNEKEYQRALNKLNHARDNKIWIELTEKEEKSVSQNNYLHLCLAHYAAECGYQTIQYVKDNILKVEVCPDIFLFGYIDKFGKRITDKRSVSSLTKEEVSIVLDRWIRYCEEICEIQMPNPDDYRVRMWLTKQYKQKGLL